MSVSYTHLDVYKRQTEYAQPDAEYPLGTDQLGRCTLSRLLYGARYSIGISLPVLLILSVIGLIVGTFSACAGEKADHFITILCDVFIAFPSLIIAIAVIGVLGNGLQMCIRDRFQYVPDKKIWAYSSMALSAAAVCSYMGAYWFLW